MVEVGIYFGPEFISITQFKGKKVLKNIILSRKEIIGSVVEQKHPEEVKLATALKGEFIKNGISPIEVNVSLAGEDLIVRTFDLPIFLSKKELEYTAIAFEAKKYIPFKIEELVFDFKLKHDRKDKKILVLFVGIKKEILDKYLAIFKELQITVKSIEYAGFGNLRLLRSSGLKDKGIIGFINVDLEEETNFIVCQDGFPLFSRDILLGQITTPVKGKISLMDKLKSEIRVSLDYFQRKFPTKPIDTAVLLCSSKTRPEILELIKSLDLLTVPLDVSRVFAGDELEVTTAPAKSYATAIGGIQKLRYPINLLTPAVKAEEESTGGLPIEITEIKINPKAVLLSILIISLSLGWGWFRRIPLQIELKSIRAAQPKIAGVTGNETLSTITGVEQQLSHKINVLDKVVKNRFYLSEALEIIPRYLPKGAWLTSFSFNTVHDGWEFKFEGSVYLNDPDREFAAVNDIVLGLKNEPKFGKYFKDINVVSMERTQLAELEVTKFAILCH